MAPKMNDTRAVILGLMLHGAKSGGDVIAQAEKWSPYFSITRSQVYREMPDMATESLIKVTQVLPRGRTEYAINPSGKTAFRKWWIATPTALDPVRNTMALKLALAGPICREDEVRSMLDEYRKMHVSEATRLTQLANEAHEAGMDYDTSALEWSIKYHKMNISWIVNEMR